MFQIDFRALFRYDRKKAGKAVWPIVKRMRQSRLPAFLCAQARKPECVHGEYWVVFEQ
ncbi:MAG: hypothetical protein LUI14_05335 [Lachnospiraceae bacterium]|nr:hypothetical protein [Lachnospiraceae bacterium]